MTVTDQSTHVREFFATSLAIITSKGKDYAPENIAMIDVFYAAAEDDTTPQQVLWTYVRKHLTAIRGWMRGGILSSEDITSRLQDVANYMALIDFVTVHEGELLFAITTYNADPDNDIDDDQREAMDRWLLPTTEK